MWCNANLSLNVAFVRNDPHATRSTAGWRLIIFPYGMPACVTPRGKSHSPKGSLVHICKCGNLALRYFFLFRLRVFPRALGSVARREPARTPRARLGPGRGPWHVLWGFKVARLLGEAFRVCRAIQAPGNPRTG